MRFKWDRQDLIILCFMISAGQHMHRLYSQAVTGNPMHGPGDGSNSLIWAQSGIVVIADRTHIE
ncbi:MAG: hypothetical protein U1C33_07660, partial [Candidatus Cloacimonadaceae bacterium]|nr:hypothetical protein [Candidatus Cloacimonadaceae bacterium]